jgi:hypothetical protein
MRRLLLALPLACDPAAAEPDPEQPPVEFTCQPGAAADPFVDCIESFAPQAATFGQDRMPGVVLGPPVPGAPGMGGLDVLSLGCGGEVTVYFDDPQIVDGPGPDFIVFENALAAGDTVFVEPARVYVSPDGRDWYAFPCVPGGDADGCAGRTPVNQGADPTDPAAAGGDAFDLADLGLDRARYVRLVDVGEAHHGDRMWCGSGNGGFDLDAVAVVHAPG